jgi:putative endonuclease
MGSRFRGNDETWISAFRNDETLAVVPAKAGTHPDRRLESLQIAQIAQLVIRTAGVFRYSIVAMTKQPAVYILASQHSGTLYIGVTSNLVQRIWQHRSDLVAGFTREHGLHRLVWFEMHESMYAAITREKQLKKWNRAWKIDLIRTHNAQWRDLWDVICRG